MEEEINFKVWWDEKEKILRIFVEGELNGEISKKIINEVSVVMEQHGKRINFLVDLSKVTKPVFSSMMRKSIIEAVRRMGFEETGKTAIIGASATAKIVTIFVLKIFKKENLKFFSTEEDAFEWFKEV